ncbi:hypothetical protein SPHFLASMR4Y_01504 [Sphingorhabdus sp. SMR4y]|nr:hypothetical protein SPHFLASMR4Y_01504 [Sphingorhabdus sp. SMR4y]
MKHKDFIGILKGVKDATAFVQGKRFRARIVPEAKPNKAAHPTQPHSS